MGKHIETQKPRGPRQDEPRKPTARRVSTKTHAWGQRILEQWVEGHFPMESTSLVEPVNARGRWCQADHPKCYTRGLILGVGEPQRECSGTVTCSHALKATKAVPKPESPRGEIGHLEVSTPSLNNTTARQSHHSVESSHVPMGLGSPGEHPAWRGGHVPSKCTGKPEMAVPGRTHPAR